MNKIQKKALKLSRKVLNLFVAILMVVQPIGIPTSYVLAANEDSVVENVQTVEVVETATTVEKAPVKEITKEEALAEEAVLPAAVSEPVAAVSASEETVE